MNWFHFAESLQGVRDAFGGVWVWVFIAFVTVFWKMISPPPPAWEEGYLVDFWLGYQETHLHYLLILGLAAGACWRYHLLSRTIHGVLVQHPDWSEWTI